MGTNMLDTYTLVKRLTQAGVPEAQAEAHMSVFLDMSERGFATKGDIAALERRMDDLATHEALSEVKKDVAELRADFEARMSAMEARLSGMEVRLSGIEMALSDMEMRLMVRLGGLMVTLMTIGFAVLKFTIGH